MEIMDIKKYAIAVGALAVMVLIVMSVVIGFTKQARTETTVGIVDLNVTVVGNPVSLGSSYPYPQTVTGCVNSTGANSLSSSYYSIYEGGTAASGGTLTLASTGTHWNNTKVNCSMLYLANSDGQAAGDKFITGMTIFATFAGVLVLAIIGMLIVRLYNKED